MRTGLDEGCSGARGQGKNAHLETLRDKEWGIWLKTGRRTKVLLRTPRCLTLVVVVVVAMADICPVGSSGMISRKPGLQRAEHVFAMLLRDILTKGQT